MMPPIVVDGPLAAIIPETKIVRAALDKAEEEAGLLRRLLRLANTRDREAERITREWTRGGEPHAR